MLLEKINAWLKLPDDYQIGLALLAETGFKGFTLTILSKGDDAYNRTRLEVELRKWAESQTNSKPNNPGPNSFSKENSAGSVSGFQSPLSGIQSPAGESMAVVQLNRQIYDLMDERTEAKAWIRALEQLGNSEEACAKRLPYACQVKAITRQIDDLYSRLDFFDEQGYWPPAPDDLALIVDDTKLLMNMRSYVSRYEKKLKKKTLTSEQRQSAEKLLKQYSDEKKRLELKLSKQNDSHPTGQQTTDRPIHPPPLSSP